MTSPESYFREAERSLLIRNQELREENERLQESREKHLRNCLSVEDVARLRRIEEEARGATMQECSHPWLENALADQPTEEKT